MPETIVIEVPPAVLAQDDAAFGDTPDAYEIQIDPRIPGGCMIIGHFSGRNGPRRTPNGGSSRRLVAMLLEERDRLKEENAVLRRIPNGEVWHWQGDGEDFPESLACPVIMAPETLRGLLAEKDESATRVLILEAHIFKMAEWLIIEKRIAEETIGEMDDDPDEREDPDDGFQSMFRKRAADISDLLSGSAGESLLRLLHDRLGLWEWVTEMACTVQQDSVLGRQPWMVIDVDGDVLGRGDEPHTAIEDARRKIEGDERKGVGP